MVLARNCQVDWANFDVRIHAIDHISILVANHVEPYSKNYLELHVS